MKCENRSIYLYMFDHKKQCYLAYASVSNIYFHLGHLTQEYIKCTDEHLN